MQPEQSAMDMSRRKFLRTMAGVAAGAVIGPGMSETNIQLTQFAAEHNISSVPTGNAFMAQAMADCKRTPEAEACKEDLLDPAKLVVVAPIGEEATTRVLPSYVLDRVRALRARSRQPAAERKSLWATLLDPIEKTGYTLDKTEMALGAVTTAVFAGVHNRTSQGFNTTVVPTTQLAMGAICWYLVRKSGAAAAVTTHATHNLYVLQRYQ